MAKSQLDLSKETSYTVIMKNTYRVDRVDSKRVPCGMNSIRYLGESFNEALKTFNILDVGLDSWDKRDTNYGLIISKWNSSFNDYVIIESKGLNA